MTGGAREAPALPSIAGGQGKRVERVADQRGRRVRDSGKKLWGERGVGRCAGASFGAWLFLAHLPEVQTGAAGGKPTARVTEDRRKAEDVSCLT